MLGEQLKLAQMSSHLGLFSQLNAVNLLTIIFIVCDILSLNTKGP